MAAKTYYVAALWLTVVAVRHANAGLIANGGFETNGGAGSSIFASWTVLTETGSQGTWYAQTGTGTPVNAFPVAAPPDGSFAAMTDGAGASSQVFRVSPLASPPRFRSQVCSARCSSRCGPPTPPCSARPWHC